ncbi:iron-containing alcohol dehydrogenase [Thiomicrorhabdus heinhorstiae]|uniref:Iron-containing alcohol dehydrogenase n=1 Tax=Thiomicrorhabdus heinhorstiae TaxID=2748010 RepID=A0ABS0BVY8_9GAMM|nr:iron-containing alcohol dehydrogenase [Thiomicrorhabdus heinhorstiae]MBF6057549.1 iron-containing alcohol dehydrogenase [Thiomicrorhabdus heinhorstiae]
MNTYPINPFQFAPMPHLHFGWGIRYQLSEHLQQSFSGILILIASPSLMKTGRFGEQLQQTLTGSFDLKVFTVSGEPSPDLIDDIVSQCPKDAQAVLGLGGGSVLDAAKAIAGLLPSQTSVMDYLEGVGAGKQLQGPTCPFIAIPTTAGTGSETTKNSVLSRIGFFKKSFRSNLLLAQSAWLDPQLLETCPQEVLYATGMDAFTQLLESYTTLKPNPLTDALAWQGMQMFIGSFEAIKSQDSQIRQQGYCNLMLAATLSGTTLANAGLGAVHGLAGPIGAFFEAPHGIVCARLLAPITQANIDSLQQSGSIQAEQTLNKYRMVSRLLNPEAREEDLLESLIERLKHYARDYTPQGLSAYGLTSDNLQPVLDNCRSGSMLGNPLVLEDEQLLDAIQQAL